MANRCPGCNKFPAYQADDPEVESLEVDGDGVVSATVRVMVSSECCGEQMREYSFDVDQTIEIPDAKAAEPKSPGPVAEVLGTHDDFSKRQPEPGESYQCIDPNCHDAEEMPYHDHELEVEEDGVESQDKYEGKGRGQKHLYGFKLDYTVKCSECPFSHTGSIEDFVQFSHMDEV